MITAAERQRQNTHKEPFLRVVDNFGKVGYLPDGTWEVGWRVSGKKGLVWHKHESVLGVLEQIDRVIQRYSGVRVDPPQEGEPGAETSLPAIREGFVIHGEVPQVDAIAQRVFRLATLLDPQNTPNPMAVAAEIHALRNKIGSHVKNEHKVRARNGLSQALDTDNLATLRFSAMEAVKPLFERTEECLSIMLALYKRASLILKWVEEQDKNMRNLKRMTSGIIFVNSSRNAQNSLVLLETLIPDARELQKLVAFEANPFRETGQKSEVQRVAELRALLDTKNFDELLQVALRAYPHIENYVKENDPSSIPDYFKRYRIPT